MASNLSIGKGTARYWREFRENGLECEVVVTVRGEATDAINRVKLMITALEESMDEAIDKRAELTTEFIARMNKTCGPG